MDRGSHEENASKQKPEPGFDFIRTGKARVDTAEVKGRYALRR
jgi:hypothetical protein